LKACPHLYCLPPVLDPSNEVVEVLIQCLDLNLATWQSSIPESELPDLHQKVVDLLDLLQKNLPDKTGEKGKWNFEKAHSILHKVHEIVLWETLITPLVKLLRYVLVCTWHSVVCNDTYTVHT
jgi:hypothetical protein